MRSLDLSIRSSYAESERLSAAVDRLLEENRVPYRESHAVRLAIEEFVSSVIRHGADDDPRSIDVEIAIERGRLVVHVADDGRRFDPNRVPAPPFDRPLRDEGHSPLSGLSIPRLHQAFCETLHEV